MNGLENTHLGVSNGGNTKGIEAAAVGYRRPPTKSQFKKGRSGNPKGRPKSRGDLGPLLAEAFDEPVRIRIGKKVKKVTKEEAMLTSIVNSALKGDLKAVRALARIGERAGALKPIVNFEPEPVVLWEDQQGKLRPARMTPKDGRIWRKHRGWK
jgi:hypothetical protein